MIIQGCHLIDIVIPIFENALYSHLGFLYAKSFLTPALSLLTFCKVTQILQFGKASPSGAFF